MNSTRRRRLVPKFDTLESLAPPAPTFMTAPGAFPGLYVDSLTIALQGNPDWGDGFRWDTWFNDSTMQDAVADGSATFLGTNPPGVSFLQSNEAGQVEAAFNGPNSGDPLDFRPFASPQALLSVTHHNQDSIQNFTPNAVNPREAVCSADTYSAGGTNLVVQQGGGNLDIHFHAHYDTSTPARAPFGSDATFQADVGPMEFNTAPGVGFIATKQGVGIVSFDPNFGNNAGSDVDYETVIPVNNGDTVGISYTSQLETYINDTVNPGITANDAHLNWTLSLQLT